MTSVVPVLVCFAVNEEARPFRKIAAAEFPCEVIVTGIGSANTERSFHSALKRNHPQFVITSGFAGGLNPNLTVGDIIFDVEKSDPISPALLAAGARPGRFHCLERIAVTAKEKEELWKATNADAVEMESAIIRKICAERGIRSATIRVISDGPEEDLPLDFNQITNSKFEMHYGKLGWQLAKSPAKIARLLEFRQRINQCASKLAVLLVQVLKQIHA